MRFLETSQAGLGLQTKARFVLAHNPSYGSRYALQSELAREWLHAADRDPNRKLAWVNSICALFLFAGAAGYRAGSGALGPLPPIEETAAAIVEPLPPPPAAPDQTKQEQNDENPPEISRVIVVTPAAPNINFAVPTIGSLVVPAAAAKAPPLSSLDPVARLRTQPTVLEPTGDSGERPQPPYPGAAIEQGQQGSVMLRLTVDDNGLVRATEIARSSGSALLDRAASEFVRRRWTLPSGGGARTYEATITYRLQTD